MFRKIFASIFVAHASFVEYNNRFSKRDEEFSQQSADDLLMDSVATGDVLLFNRKWFYYHLPTAIMIKMHNIMYGKDSPDHAAVIVQDSLGTPFVYERTPFGGCKIRPYDKRILHSKAQLITLLPLNPRLELSIVQRNLNRANVHETIANSTWKDSELVRFVACSYNFMISSSNGHVCANTEFLIDTLSKLNITPAGHRSRDSVYAVRLMDFVDSSIRLQGSVFSYDPKEVENYNRTVAPVRKPAKVESNKPKLTMLKTRDHYEVPVLPKLSDLPPLVPTDSKTVLLDLYHHVYVRTR